MITLGRAILVGSVAAALSAAAAGERSPGASSTAAREAGMARSALAVDSGPALVLPPLPEAGDGPDQLAQLMQVMVSEILVDGVTAFPYQTIERITAPYAGRVVTAGELQALRLELSQLYLAQGFINSGVIVPDQDVRDGVVHLQAVEGVLEAIRIDGDPHLTDHFIRSRVERFTRAPLNANRVQTALRHLQQSEQIANLDARLLPGEQPGQAVLHLQVFEPERFYASIAADNYGSASVGANRSRLTLEARNVTGWGEQLSVGGVLTDGADDTFAALSVPLTRYDTSLHVSYARSNSRIIEKVFKDLDIESQTDSWGVTLRQPVYDNLVTEVALSAGLEVKHSRTELLDTPFSFSPGAQDGEADTTVMQLGVELLRRDQNSVLSLRTSYRRGIDALGATIFTPGAPDADFNPTGADGEFDMILAQGLYLRRLNVFPGLERLHDRAQVAVRGTLQYAFDSLLALEKVAVGGVNTVRGYRENLLVRDNGAVLSVEVQVPFFGYRGEPHPRNVVLAPFIDLGYSWDHEDNDLTSTVRNTDDRRGIVGVGLGVTWTPHEWLQADVYWGADVWDNFDGDDPRAGDGGNRDLQGRGVHFNVSFGVRF